MSIADWLGKFDFVRLGRHGDCDYGTLFQSGISL